MKNISTIVSLIIITSSVCAHTIKGTAVLKGSLKTEFALGGKKTSCTVKVEKVKNLRYEDSYGNPGYNVIIRGTLRGGAKLNKEFTMINIFPIGNRTETRDLEYFSADGAKMTINDQGRLVSVILPVSGKEITCAF